MCRSKKSSKYFNLLWGCAHATALAALTLVLTTPFASAGPVRPAEIPLAAYLGPTVSMRATIGGVEGTFMFDTGAGVSSVTPAFAAKIGCAPWGRIAMFKMTGERVTMARCDLVRVRVDGRASVRPTVGVFDLMALLPKEALVVDGLLGLDIFDGQAITLDQQRRVIVVETPASLSRRAAQGRELPIRLVRDAQGLALTVDAAVTTPKGTAWMELDTGNFGGFIIGEHMAPLFGLDPKSRTAQHVTLTIAGVAAHGDADVKDLIMDGNIGQRFLRLWLVTLDLKNARVWLAPTKATP